MKKLVYVFLFGTIISLVGCTKKDEMIDYIPTSMEVSEGLDETQGETDDSALEGEDGTSNEQIDTTMNTFMYVRLDEFGAFLNIRNKPSRDGAVVGALAHTDKVEVVEIKDGWASILVGDNISYVSADFLSDVIPEPIEAPLVTAVPTPEPTETPTATTEPSKKPAAEEAKPTKKPEETKPSKKPEAKEEAKPTKKPEEANSSEPTKKPEPTKAPKPTKTPEPTKAPEPTKEAEDEVTETEEVVEDETVADE